MQPSIFVVILGQCICDPVDLSCRNGGKLKFLCSLSPTKLNSLSPSGALYVNMTHKIPLPVLTSGPWVRLDSRATNPGQVNPKDVSKTPSCLRERDSARCCSSSALCTTSVETFCQTGKPCMQPEIGRDQDLCVKTKTPNSDVHVAPRKIATFRTDMENAQHKWAHGWVCVGC